MMLTDIGTGQPEDVPVPAQLPWLETGHGPNGIVYTPPVKMLTQADGDYWTVAVQRWALSQGYEAPTAAEIKKNYEHQHTEAERRCDFAALKTIYDHDALATVTRLRDHVKEARDAL